MTTIQDYPIIHGRAVRAADIAPRATLARWIVIGDLVTVEDNYGRTTSWVIGIQRGYGYTTLVLDTPNQPTYWAMRDDDVLTREGHDYTEFANAWEAAQDNARALQG